MSFIYNDKKLIDDLIIAGQKHYNNFGKLAQDTSLNDLGLILINNLQQQLGALDPNTPPSVSTQSDMEVNLKSSDLQNIGTLANFLADNQVTVNGQRVVFSDKENPDNPNYVYMPLAARGETLDRPTVEKGFFINKDLLHKYIGSLQSQLAKTPNPALAVTLNNIINQSNQFLETKITDSKESPAAPKAVEPAPTNQTSQTEKVSPEIINNLVTSLPLRQSDIDFRRINAFFDDYKKLLSTSKKDTGGVEQAIAQAEEAMRNASNATKTNITNFNLNWSLTGLKPFLKAPEGTSIVELVKALETLLSYVSYVIGDLRSRYGTSSPFQKSNLTDQQLSYINQVIGINPTSESVYKNNLDRIQNWKPASMRD